MSPGAPTRAPGEVVIGQHAWNPLAIASMVLGVAWCMPFAGIAAIVTGLIARKQIADSNPRQRGEQLALAGIIFGVVGFAFSFVWLLGKAFFRALF